MIVGWIVVRYTHWYSILTAKHVVELRVIQLHAHQAVLHILSCFHR